MRSNSYSAEPWTGLLVNNSKFKRLSNKYMSCKHKYKIHETYWAQATTTGTNIKKRAIVVCEKCAQVKDVEVE